MLVLSTTEIMELRATYHRYKSCTSKYVFIVKYNSKGEIIKYEVVQLVARGDLQDPSAYANGKRLGSRKLKEQSQNTKKAYTVMQAYISIDSWKVMDAHLQTIKQKGTQDEYFGVAND